MNVIYIPATNDFLRHFDFVIPLWEGYAERTGSRLHISSDNLKDSSKIEGSGAWKPWISDDLSEMDYDRVLIVDIDTIIRKNSPNIFEIPGDFNVTLEPAPIAERKWHVNQWGKIGKMDERYYFNSGVILASKEVVLTIKEHINEYYEYWIKNNSGRRPRLNAYEQTPLNIISYTVFPEKVRHLRLCWNDCIMRNYKSKFDFINNKSYIWHFTGPNLGGNAITNKVNLMKSVMEYR